MLNLILLFLLFIIPFIVNPFIGGFFEFPKVILAEIAIELLILVFFLRSRISPKKIPKIFLSAVGALFALSLVGLIFFPTSTIFFGNQFRLQGAFLLWHLLFFSLISSQIELKISRILPYLSLITLLLVTIFMGVESNGRSVGTLGEPNALAATAIFFWPFGYFFSAKMKRGGLVKFLSLLLAFLIIFLSESRSGLVALIIQIGFLLILKLSRNWKAALTGVFVIFFCALSLPFLEINEGYKFEDRAEVWRVSLFATWQSPIYGQGFGNVESALKSTSKSLNSDLQYQYVDSAHNIFLDYLIAGGLLGLGSLLILISASLRNFIKQKKVLEIVLLLGLLAVLSFNPVSVVILIAFWWVVGQGFRNTT